MSPSTGINWGEEKKMFYLAVELACYNVEKKNKENLNWFCKGKVFVKVRGKTNIKRNSKSTRLKKKTRRKKNGYKVPSEVLMG